MCIVIATAATRQIERNRVVLGRGGKQAGRNLAPLGMTGSHLYKAALVVKWLKLVRLRPRKADMAACMKRLGGVHRAV